MTVLAGRSASGATLAVLLSHWTEDPAAAAEKDCTIRIDGAEPDGRYLAELRIVDRDTGNFDPAETTEILADASGVLAVGKTLPPYTLHFWTFTLQD